MKKYVVVEIDVVVEDGYIVEGYELKKLYEMYKDKIVDILDEYEVEEVIDEFDISWIEDIK